MATYKYKMADPGRETYNYVNYNIAPDYEQPIYDGNQITVSGSFVCRDFNVRYISCELCFVGEDSTYTGLSDKWEANISVAAGKTYNFTAKFNVDSGAYDGDRSARGIKARLSIELNELSPDEGLGSGAYFESDDAHRFMLIFYRLDQKILAMDFERATAEGKWADDGLYLQCKTLRIAKNSQAAISDFTKATITCTGSDGSSRSVNLTNDQLSAALTANGYAETAPGIFADFVSALGVDYTLTLTLGDEYEQTSLADTVMRSFARLHLSGAKNGGVAVGMFSSATDAQPKFEVADSHMTFLYGGASIPNVNEYALGEHPTGGHWIDGKPIYRYVWHGSMKGTTVRTPRFNIGCVPETVVRTSFYTKEANSTFRAVPYSYSDGNYSISGWLIGSDVIMSFAKGWNTRTFDVIACIEYTKSDASAEPALPGPELFDDPPCADEGVARADYIAMMAGIEIPEDAGAGSAPGAFDPQSEDGPGIEGESQHSARYPTVKLYSDARVWNAQMVRDAAGRWITAEEAQQILNDTDTD